LQQIKELLLMFFMVYVCRMAKAFRLILMEQPIISNLQQCKDWPMVNSTMDSLSEKTNALRVIWQPLVISN
jgi:hypothetical protein